MVQENLFPQEDLPVLGIQMNQEILMVQEDQVVLKSLVNLIVL